LSCDTFNLKFNFKMKKYVLCTVYQSGHDRIIACFIKKGEYSIFNTQYNTQTRLYPSPRLKCIFELLKETCTDTS